MTQGDREEGERGAVTGPPLDPPLPASNGDTEVSIPNQTNINCISVRSIRDTLDSAACIRRGRRDLLLLNSYLLLRLHIEQDFLCIEANPPPLTIAILTEI